MGVARQPKVQKHGAAVRPDQHVGGLDVEVADVLLVQAVRGLGHGGAQAGDFLRVEGGFAFKPVLQCLALDVFHHQVRQTAQIACSHEARHMRARQRGHDHQLDFETEDGFCAVTRRHAWDLHGHRELGLASVAVWARGMLHFVDVRHAAGMDAAADLETVDQGAGFEQLQRPSSSREAKYSGSPALRMAAAAAEWS